MIKFIRSQKAVSDHNDLELSVMDNPEYVYYTLGGFHEDTHLDHYGWNQDLVEIFYNDKSVGFLKWNISIAHQCTDNVAIILKKDYLNSGIGVLAIVKWIDYVFNDLRYRKISFDCVGENIRGREIYELSVDIGGSKVGVKKQDIKLRDGLFHDLHCYEVLREDFNPNKLFKRLLTRASKISIH